MKNTISILSMAAFFICISQSYGQWTRVTTLPYPYTENYVSIAIKPNGSIFVGTDLDGGYRSDDGGSSWTYVIYDQQYGVHKVFFFAFDLSGNVYAATVGKGVYKSTNDGGSWDNYYGGTLPISDSYMVATNSSGTIFAADYGEIYRSTNVGTSWSRVKTTAYGGASGFRTIAFGGGDTVYIGATGDGFSGSPDNGQNWYQQTSGLTAKPYALAGESGGLVFSGNQGSGVFKSTDYGLHWSQANDGLGNLYVNTLSIDAGGVIYAGTQGGVYTSVDSGKTWVAANSGLTNLNIYALAFSPSSKVYAGAYTTGHTGGLWVANMPLPITLVSFTARGNPHGAGVLLEWVTASETNNYGFYVQSRVNSRQTFEDLPNSFVPGHGTSIEQHHYSFIHTTGVAGKCEYRLKQVDLDGTVHYPQVATLKSGQSALAGEKPVEFSLSQNYPNPFNPSTVIRYGLPVEVHLSLAVYNALGQLVCRLADEEQVAGYHEVKFDGTDLGSGVYFYRLTAGNFTQTRKLLLVR